MGEESKAAHPPLSTGAAAGGGAGGESKEAQPPPPLATAAAAGAAKVGSLPKAAHPPSAAGAAAAGGSDLTGVSSKSIRDATGALQQQGRWRRSSQQGRGFLGPRDEVPQEARGGGGGGGEEGSGNPAPRGEWGGPGSEAPADGSHSNSHRKQLEEEGRGGEEGGKGALQRFEGLTLAWPVQLWYGLPELRGLDDLPVG